MYLGDEQSETSSWREANVIPSHQSGASNDAEFEHNPVNGFVDLNESITSR
jgi:hypothetical protein